MYTILYQLITINLTSICKSFRFSTTFEINYSLPKNPISLKLLNMAPKFELLMFISVLLTCHITYLSSFQFPLSRRISNFVNRHNNDFLHSPKPLLLKSKKMALYSSESESVDDEKILRQIAMMISLWENVAFPSEEGIEFKLSDFGLTRSDVKGFLKHFQNCKDCAGKS